MASDINESQRYAERRGKKYDPAADVWAKVKAKPGGVSVRFDNSPTPSIKVGSLRSWSTPMGIYAYPLDDPKVFEAIKAHFEDGRSSKLFASNGQYIQFLKPRSNKGLVVIGKGGQLVKGRGYLDKIAEAAGPILWKALKVGKEPPEFRLGMTRVDYKSPQDVVEELRGRPFRSMWNFISSNSRDGRKQRLLLSKILRAAGVTTLIDNGSGAISSDIPAQTVFLLSKHVNVVGVGHNIHGRKAPKLVSHSQMLALFIEGVKRATQQLNMTYQDNYKSGSTYVFEDVSVDGGEEFDVEYGRGRPGTGRFRIEVARGKVFKQEFSMKPRSEVVIRREFRAAINDGMRSLGLLHPLTRTPLAMTGGRR